jgi:hypothetical protein
MTGSGDLVPLATAEHATATIWDAIRMRPRTVLVTAALAIVTLGLVMNWSALVAAGIAPLLISALPCAVMCALGLCMSRMGKSSCAAETAPQQSAGGTPLELNPPSERLDGPQLAFDLTQPAPDETASVDQLRQQQDRTPTHA